MVIANSIVEHFSKCYGNTISETKEAAVKLHAEERDCVLLHVSRILNLIFGLI